MTTPIPITLVGDNLGKRHLYLNSLVNDTYKHGEDFDIIKNLPELFPIDRLFKIDLASKFKNVDYIIQNLKDDDMLYVSRALKAKWLVDKKYEDIINPQYLEDRIYPEMITTAVVKLQHWIHLMLNDEARCEQFYQHYKEKNFDLAIKFLMKSSKNYILNEFPNVILKISPHSFKILCEKCSHIAKIFYDSLPKNDELKSKYLDKEKDYFATLRHLLKTDPDLVLDITERYFNRNVFDRFSATQTKLIMTHHKDRFWQKPELYTAWLLNTQAVADNLDNEEAKKLVLKLAQAKYLTHLGWFNFKSVAPFIKRVNFDERAEFKKQIFVKKDIGEEVENWPYQTPEPPYRENEHNTSIFEDKQREPYEYEHLKRTMCLKRIMKKKCARYEMCDIFTVCPGDYERKCKTLLDKLFDEFRFASFGQTLYELRKRIAAESSPQNREFMMLVLVSKSGGRPDAIALLLEMLAKHCNEPPNVRAAIIRSFVKRAQVWRLPEISWNQLLEFGQGLGLDGNTPVAECYEGLHAVVIRSLLSTGECQHSVQKAFMGQFSTLINDYSLNTQEKKIIKEMLPKMLLSITKEQENIEDALDPIEKLIDTLKFYKIKVDTYPGLIETIVGFAEKDVSQKQLGSLLISLFQSKIARKQLFRYTFDLVKSDASFVNALRHDTAVLNGKNYAENYVKRHYTNVDKFLSKLCVYFSEMNGLASIFLNEFKTVKNAACIANAAARAVDGDCVRIESINMLGRPFAFLLGEQLESYLCELDALEDKESKLLAPAVRANAHVTRPTLDIKAFGWKKAGTKLLANRFLKCRIVEIDTNIEELLKWKRTARLALALSKRTTRQTEVFVKLTIIRPTIAIKLGLKLMKLHGEELDPLIWETIKPIIQELDVTKADKLYIVQSLADIEKVPLRIRPEYSSIIYTSFLKESLYKAMPPLCHIEILLPDVNEQFIENLVHRFLNDAFIPEKLTNNKSDVKCNCLYIRILVKFLLLSQDEEIQKHRLETYGGLFLAKMEEIKNNTDNNEFFLNYLRETLKTFVYNKVFLNKKYVSPLPVMEKAVVWLQKLFTVEEHFGTFIYLHLTMLYSKAVRQSVDKAPELFADEKRKRNDGEKVVGNLYGKHVANELSILTAKYFDSIIELYSPNFIIHLQSFIQYNVSSNYISSVIKGFLEGSKGSEYRLGIYLLEDQRYNLTIEHYQELTKYVNGLQNKQAQWFAFALINDNN